MNRVNGRCVSVKVVIVNINVYVNVSVNTNVDVVKGNNKSIHIKKKNYQLQKEYQKYFFKMAMHQM